MIEIINMFIMPYVTKETVGWVLFACSGWFFAMLRTRAHNRLLIEIYRDRVREQAKTVPLTQNNDIEGTKEIIKAILPYLKGVKCD